MFIAAWQNGKIRPFDMSTYILHSLVIPLRRISEITLIRYDIKGTILCKQEPLCSRLLLETRTQDKSEPFNIYTSCLIATHALKRKLIWIFHQPRLFSPHLTGALLRIAWVEGAHETFQMDVFTPSDTSFYSQWSFMQSAPIKKHSQKSFHTR